MGIVLGVGVVVIMVMIVPVVMSVFVFVFVSMTVVVVMVMIVYTPTTGGERVDVTVRSIGASRVAKGWRVRVGVGMYMPVRTMRAVAVRHWGLG